jgi:hypothetical protein
MNRRRFTLGAIAAIAAVVASPVLAQQPARVVVERWQSQWFDFAHSHGTAVTLRLANGSTIRQAARTQNTARIYRSKNWQQMIEAEKDLLRHWIRHKYGNDAIIIE